MAELSYQVVAGDLRRRIVNGDFSDGQRIPTEAQLASQFGVSRQTVRRAFQDLVADGLVDRSRGRGTFARAVGDGYVRQVGSIDDLMGLSDDTVMQVIRPLTRVVNVMAAGRLRLTSDVVFEVAFVRLHDDVPFCFTTVVLPPDVATRLASVAELHSRGTTSTMTIIGLLDDVLPARIEHALQSITVDRVPVSAAEHLRCDPGSPALRIDRLYQTTSDEPVELAISHFLPEHYSYRVQLRRSR